MLHVSNVKPDQLRQHLKEIVSQGAPDPVPCPALSLTSSGKSTMRSYRKSYFARTMGEADWTRRAPLADFKPHRRVRAAGAGSAELGAVCLTLRFLIS